MKRLISGPATRWAAAPFLTAIFLLTACSPVQSDPGPTTASEKNEQIAMLVAAYVPMQHLSGRELDDEISQRGLDLFIKSLDPRKLYFYQSDIDEFQDFAEQLDDMLKEGDLSASEEIFEVFITRVNERSAVIQELLVQEHDFTVDEELVLDRDILEYAKDEAEANDRWRRRVKFDILSQRAERIAAQRAAEAVAEAAIEAGEEPEPYLEEEDSITDLLDRRYKSLQRRWEQTDSDDLLEMFLTAVINGFDPHTSYMSPTSYVNFKIQMSLNLQGIGATLQSEDGYTIVKSLVPGGAADKQGELEAEDKIVAVGQGEEGPMNDVVDMKLDDVVQQIRGEPGTIVRLKLDRRGAPPRVIQIVRAQIELTDSEAQSEVFEVGEDVDGSPYQIGVIDLPSFYLDIEALQNGDPNFKSTTRDVRKILRDFSAQDVDGVVLDLRFNGGGSLQEAINLTGLFIEDGPVVQVKGPQGPATALRDRDSSIEWDGPLVILISQFSASASEILAGAIQDYHRGVIVGDHSTHGKGTVQTLIDLKEELFRGAPGAPELGGLKFTMQQFYRPNGASTQVRGVLSDIELPSLTTHYDVAESDLDYPVEFDEIDAGKFDRFPFVNRAILDELTEESETRRETSEDFQRLDRDIALYLEQKEKQSVTLNEEEFLREREELSADQQEQETFEDLAGGDSNIDRNFYLDEAMAITVDYVEAIEEGGYEYTPSNSGGSLFDSLFGL
jgi:carboxyl-terminal processing protease